MSSRQMQSIYDIQVDELSYNSIISAIPRSWKKVITNNRQENVEELECASNFSQMLEMPKWSQIVYNQINRDNTALNKLRSMWTKKLQNEIVLEEIQNAFINIKKITEVVKHRSFQFRLLQNIIYLNDRLIHFGKASSDRCTQCNAAKETITHLFFECSITKNIFQKIQEYCELEYGVNMNYDLKTVIFNTVDDKPRSFINLVILVAKFMIYSFRCRNKKVTSNTIVQKIEFIHSMEHKKALSEGNIKKYNERWPDKIENDVTI